MASIRKSFSLRNGVQVDDDNLIVNSNGLVGIGTSIPTETFDVRGTAKVVGLITATSIYTSDITVAGISTFKNVTVGITTITSGIITATSGVVTYYGDGGRLLNLPTSQWLDVDVGLGFTSIYAQGFVGVSTVDPRFVFQIGGNTSTTVAGFENGVGISSSGNILATGIVTAFSFVGFGSNIELINASNITSGTLNNSRLPSNISVSGIVTATTFRGTTFIGNLVGIADTANDITSSSNIRVNSINSGFSTSGISTVYNRLSLLSSSRLGIGTENPSADIHIRKQGITSILLSSDGTNASTIIFGRSVTGIGNNAELRFGNTNSTFTDSTDRSLDIINYDTGNFNYYIHNGSPGISTGNFNWIYGQGLNKLMTLTYTGRLGINQPNPTSTFHVVGTANVTGSTIFGSSISVSGNISSPGILTASNSIITGIASVSTFRVRTTSSTYPFQIGSNPDLNGGGVGMNETGKIVTAGDITSRNISAGIITATGTIFAASLNVASGSISGGAISGSSLNLGSGGGITAGNINASSITLSSAPDFSDITNSALYVPVMTTTQRDALTLSDPGAIIYNSSIGRHQGFDGSNWNSFW
jgi:hypothetical protein